MFYMLFFSGHFYSIDGMIMFQYAKSVLFHGAYRMDPPVYWGHNFPISRWPMGLTLFYMPFLWIFTLLPFGGDSFKNIPYDPNNATNPLLYFDRAYRFAAVLQPLIAATTAVLVYILCQQMGISRRKAAIAALVFGLASPAAAYARYDFAQPLAGLWMIAALVVMIWAWGRKPIFMLFVGLFISAGTLTRMEIMFFEGIPLLLMAYFAGSRDGDKGSEKKWLRLFSIQGLKNLFWISLPLLGTAILILYFNVQRFGNWKDVGYNDPNYDRFILNLAFITRSMIGHLVSPGRGVLLFFPISIFSLVGMFTVWKSIIVAKRNNLSTLADIRIAPVNRWAGAVMSFSFIGALLVYSSYNQWSAGLAWGPRFMVALLPFLSCLAFLSLNWIQSRLSNSTYSDKYFEPSEQGTMQTLYPEQRQIFINLINALFIVLVIMGGVFVFQGLLWNPEDYYLRGTLGLQMSDFNDGLYHFSPLNSPILTGWRNLLNPDTYDIYWLQADRTAWRLVLAVGLFTLGFLARSWIQYFKDAE